MLRLDLMSLVSVRRVMLIYSVVVLAYVAAWGPEMALPMFAMGGVITSMNLFSTGESNKLTLLFGTLPVRRRTVVASHYLVSTLALLGFLALGAVTALAIGAVRGEPLPGFAYSVLATTGVMLALLSVLLPSTLRWSARSSIVAVLISVLVGSLAFMGLARLIENSPYAGAIDRLTANDSWLAWALAGFVAVGSAALAVSYRIAVRIYERQDH